MRQARPHLILWRLLACLLPTFSTAAHADDVNVAVAANFASAMKQLAPAFEQRAGHKLVVSIGASGALYAQIRNGAPFDIFLSADAEYPKKLETEGHAAADARFTYAIGRLALWSPQPGYVDAHGDILRHGAFPHLAIANPATAPYGAAAVETLRKLGLWEKLQPRIVQGENVAQTLQFIHSGNVPLGFVALSQLQALPTSAPDSRWIVPADMHAPLRQDAVLLKRASAKAAARAFLTYLRTPGVRAQLEALGYATP